MVELSPGDVESACLNRECGWLVVVVDSLVLDRGSHPQARVSALAVVEDLEVFEDGVGQFDAGSPPPPVEELDLHPGPERFDHSIIETVAIDPIEGSRPDCWARWVNAQEVNWVPWSEWITVPLVGRRFPIAMPRAEVTRLEVGEPSIDQPTTRRLNTSNTTAQ